MFDEESLEISAQRFVFSMQRSEINSPLFAFEIDRTIEQRPQASPAICVHGDHAAGVAAVLALTADCAPMFRMERIADSFVASKGIGHRRQNAASVGDVA